MEIERYTPTARTEWDAFVSGSKNGTFLFLREYLEYHRDRFTDHSLLFRSRAGGSVVALLPANECGEVLESHGGLTYGGLVTAASMTASCMLEVFGALIDYLRGRSISLLRYRAVPHIYHRAPAEEDLYALTRLGARLVKRAPLSVIDRRRPLTPQSRRRRGARKARTAGLVCRESHDLAPYWELLSAVLHETYRARPVHSLQEITALQRALPRHLRLFGCFAAESLLAGVLVYGTDRVARAQYIAASTAGRAGGALDILFEFLLRDVFAAKDYIDLGTSEGDDIGGLNAGVLEFKESLGARLVAQDTYELEIAEARG